MGCSYIIWLFFVAHLNSSIPHFVPRREQYSIFLRVRLPLEGGFEYIPRDHFLRTSQEFCRSYKCTCSKWREFLWLHYSSMKWKGNKKCILELELLCCISGTSLYYIFTACENVNVSPAKSGASSLSAITFSKFGSSSLIEKL